jgi:tetratricopeptide (TPR) repeat protein
MTKPVRSVLACSPSEALRRARRLVSPRLRAVALAWNVNTLTSRHRICAAAVLWAAIGSYTPLLTQQNNRSGPAPASAMHRHYEAAYRLQAAGRLEEADAEHKAFLVEALSKVANGYANTGDYGRAAPIYNEALVLSPNESKVLRDYAAASIDAHMYLQAQPLLLRAVKHLPATADSETRAELHRMLGDVQIGILGKSASLQEYRTAVAINGSCENIYGLAAAQLEVSGPPAAASSVREYLSHCGDSPATHIGIGRAYALSGFPNEAAEEFKKALAEDPEYPDAHYCLGAAYLSVSKSAFDRAEAEFHKELALYPNDRYSYSQLGHIALMRNLDREAEVDYRLAIRSNPNDPANYMQLGQLLIDSQRPSEAEPLLERAIVLTVDPSEGGYQIVKAHYALARLYRKDGRETDALRELNIAEKLLRQEHEMDERRLGGASVSEDPLAKTRIPTAEQVEAAARLVTNLGPLVAASYNNLGVHAAIAGQLSVAAHDFQLAAHWNPALPGVDMNWGRAAFLAHQWKDAIEPLKRSLAGHPNDPALRDMLQEATRQLSSSERP